MNETYSIYRHFSLVGRKSKKIKGGLSLSEAQKHCSDPLTSSRTHPKGRNGMHCDWFDGYEKE